MKQKNTSTTTTTTKQVVTFSRQVRKNSREKYYFSSLGFSSHFIKRLPARGFSNPSLCCPRAQSATQVKGTKASTKILSYSGKSAARLAPEKERKKKLLLMLLPLLLLLLLLLFLFTSIMNHLSITCSITFLLLSRYLLPHTDGSRQLVGGCRGAGRRFGCRGNQNNNRSVEHDHQDEADDHHDVEHMWQSVDGPA